MCLLQFFAVFSVVNDLPHSKHRVENPGDDLNDAQCF